MHITFHHYRYKAQSRRGQQHRDDRRKQGEALGCHTRQAQTRRHACAEQVWGARATGWSNLQAVRNFLEGAEVEEKTKENA